MHTHTPKEWRGTHLFSTPTHWVTVCTNALLRIPRLFYNRSCVSSLLSHISLPPGLFALLMNQHRHQHSQDPHQSELMSFQTRPIALNITWFRAEEQKRGTKPPLTWICRVRGCKEERGFGRGNPNTETLGSLCTCYTYTPSMLHNTSGQCNISFHI